MPIRISVFGRVFAPSWPMTLATLLLLAAFVSLGRWQWHRGVAKQQTWEEFEHGTAAAPTPIPSRLDTAPRYLVVRMTGRFDARHQFLLDNRFFKGSPGYEVLTPFVLDDGRTLLVNRGWLAFTGYRDRLPEVALDTRATDAPIEISGRLDELPAGGLASGRAPPAPGTAWPKLTSFPTHDELESALGAKLEHRIVLLGDGPFAYAHEWSPTGLAPERHFSYAIQWWGFALVLLVLYFGLNLRKVS